MNTQDTAAITRFQEAFEGQAEWKETGTYRAVPIEWTISESTKEESQSVSIRFKFGILQRWTPGTNGGQWSAEWPSGYFAYGEQYIVGKEGNLLDKGVRALSEANLWHGDFDALDGPVPPVAVLIEIGEETYNGETRVKVKWINPDSDEPRARGGLPKADKDTLASLRSRFQSATKAIAGAKPSGAAPAPPRPQAAGGPSPAVAPAVAPSAAVAPAPPPAAPAPPAPPSAPGGGGAIEPLDLSDESTPF